MKCNCCGSERNEFLYSPIRSEVSLQILICNDCGLVFAVSEEPPSKPLEHAEFKNLSCDADYSQVRVGKAQMVQTAFNLFDAHSLIQFNIKKVLDMSSARGHFALKAKEYFRGATIDCLEPDNYMTKSYIDVDGISVFHKKYKDYSPSEKYDLIYSCHSLEHYRDPRQNLLWINCNLDDQGYLYIEVPNIQAIDNSNNIDEFFYDKHLYYFDANSLTSLLDKVGFEVVRNNSNMGSLSFLCIKKKQKNEICFQSSYQSNFRLISAYKKNILENRLAIQCRTTFIMDFLQTSSGIAVIVGCGRILDYLIKYCNFSIAEKTLLVDNYLSEATNELYGKKLYKLADLKFLSVNKVVILAKTSSNSLLSDINQYWPNASIKTLSNFL